MGFEPQGWDLSLKAEIEPRGWDLSLEAGGVGEEEKEKETNLHMWKHWSSAPLGPLPKKEAVYLEAKDLDVQFLSQLKHHIFVYYVNSVRICGHFHQHYCSCLPATLTQPIRLQLICCVF